MANPIETKGALRSKAIMGYIVDGDPTQYTQLGPQTTSQRTQARTVTDGVIDLHVVETETIRAMDKSRHPNLAKLVDLSTVTGYKNVTVVYTTATN